jgi:OOP family OmpA-OmpF porin
MMRFCFLCKHKSFIEQGGLMRLFILRILVVLAVMTGFASAQARLKDYSGLKDPVLFTRMPDYYLSAATSVKESQFDAYEFPVRQNNKDVKQRVEGHKTVYSYYFDKASGKPMAGALQIMRNYQNAALKLGGKVVAESTVTNRSTLVITKNGQETWAEIQATNDHYYLIIVDRQAMQQDVVADAGTLRDGLTQNGHVEVPGIFFDFNKSELKPESKPALDELASLLKGNPGLRVWVVGHTDNIGSVESNMTLSKARAAAVIAALMDAGIASGRLAPFGNGPFSPVASNSSDEGRAKNRRVELVAQP